MPSGSWSLGYLGRVMKTIQENTVWIFWELEEDQNLEAGDFEIVNQRETGKCLDVIVLNNKTKTFNKFETIEEAVNSIPEKHLLSNPYLEEE
tara:strand:+ start:402 stop:677 length:276 start_codon:yes stop_codon:yes gene_type:complete